MIRRQAPLAAALLLAGCATAPAPHRPKTLSPPAPLALLTPPPPVISWLDAGLTPGRWRYARTAEGSTATYGPFALRCVAAGSRVLLVRSDGAGAAALTLTTTYGTRTLPAAAGTAQLRAGDPLLDQLAFSRGRFMVAAAGAPRLILPAWAEPARVIEDCRSPAAPPA